MNGAAIEDTKDWFAKELMGNVWYCGEEVKDFETFALDNPVEPELVAIDGSFKAGRKGDKPVSLCWQIHVRASLTARNSHWAMRKTWPRSSA